MTEITSNIIVEHMYAKCDGSGNDMLLLDSFIEYQKSEWEMSLQYQKITVNGRACKNWSMYGWDICVRRNTIAQPGIGCLT